MKDYQQQGAQPLPNHESFFNQLDTPKEQTNALKNKIISFIKDIESVMSQPLLANHPEFLDKIASDIVSLHQLSLLSTPSSEGIMEARKLINNLLNCKVLIEKEQLEISTLDAAKNYRKNKKNKETLSLLLKVYSEEKQKAKMLIQELELLAFDLNAEMENI